MSTARDYYEVLGVSRGATEDEIKRSYYRLARQYHPDVNKEDGSAVKFKEINEAYQVLSDSEKRSLYDRYGHAGLGGQYDPNMGDFPFGDLFETLFGGGFAGARTAARRGPQPGSHLKTTLALDFEEAVFGAEKELDIPRLESCPSCRGSGAEPGTTPVRCPQCRGTGEVRRQSQSIFGPVMNVTACPRCYGEGEVVNTPCHECRGQKRVQVTRKISVKVPPGVDDGTQIRLAGEGESGSSGGPTGHLFVVISVKPHPLFKRDNQDLLLDLPLNIAQATLGDEIKVPTLDGDEKLHIPAGTQPGASFRIRNKGVPYLKRNGRGDLIVTAHVVVPTKLNDKQKELLRELGKSLPGSSGAGDRNLFDVFKDALKG
ncbi:MAG: molecular chaperone DnaJ [Anaerolineae bacterium]